ncbi:MAG: flagellin lysine-N-methylase [Sphingobacteriia bacterium]|nr:flagellin lysine-N-methylase [Sphingobacteriia bacterium]
MKLTSNPDLNCMVKDSEDYEVYQDGFLSDFKCIGDKCPDTCCKGWDMQLDRTTKSMYEFMMPELKDIIDNNGDHFIIKRDSKTDTCIKLEKGFCSIQKKHGENTLSDACFFYPRTMHKVGQRYHASAGFSCPETTRLTLFGENPFLMVSTHYPRIPYILKDYSNLVIPVEKIDEIHQFFKNLNDSEVTNKTLAKMLMLTRSLSNLPQEKWFDAINHLDKVALNLSPEIASQKLNPLYLLQSFIIIIKSCRKKITNRLQEVLNKAQQELEVKIDFETTDLIYDVDKFDFNNVTKKCLDNKLFVQHIMKRWLKGEISCFFYPFSGIGRNTVQRTQILIVKYALNYMLLSLNLINCEDVQNTTIQTIQSVSRFIDHLSDEKLFLKIIESYGWLEDSKLLGLLEDIDVK